MGGGDEVRLDGWGGCGVKEGEGSMERNRLRWPAVLVGLVLACLCGAFTPYNNIRLQNSPLAGGHFPLAAFICFLFLLILVNPLLGKVRRHWRLHSEELLLVWCMVTVATGVAYTGFMRTFILNITTPAYFASTSGDPGRTLQPMLPASLFPSDPSITRAVYSGIEGGLDMTWWQVVLAIPWSAWLGPIAWWGLFVVLLCMALIGTVGVFSHQWIENEKMNFPLLRVQAILSEQAEQGSLASFLGHRYFLLGLSIPVLLHAFNGAHTYFPEVPQIPTVFLAQPYIPKEGLLSGYYKAKIYIYPAFIGFAFLASKQISFSLWGFYLAGGLLPGLLQSLGWRLPAAALGTTFGPGLSNVEEMQMVGAFAVFYFFVIWLARAHLMLMLKSLVSRDEILEDPHGFLAARRAFGIFAVGFAGLTGWLVFFGMDLLSACLFLSVCMVFQVVASRLICQGGLPYFTLALAPTDGFLAFLSTRLIPPASLSLAPVIQKVAFVDLRESAMPSLFHCSKLSDGSEPKSRFLWGVLGALGIGLTASFVGMMILYHKYGAAALPDDWALETTRRVHENVLQLLTHPEAPKEWSIIFTAIGASVMLLLVLGYHHFIWWPLHPIGYLTTYSTAMDMLWFGFFFGWLCNVLVLRYGGVNQFREARRLFIGMVVGDVLMAFFWLVIGWFASISYHVLPL